MSAPILVDKANPRALPQPLTAICGGLAIVGVLAFLYGLSTDPQTAWLAFHSNFLFFAALAQGGLALACIFQVVGAKWPGPLRRIAEGLGAWVPITFVLACVGFFGGEYLFEWYREGAVHGKEAWLNPTRFYVSDLLIFGVLAALAMMFLRTSLRPTLNELAENGEGFAKGMAQRWTENWQGEEAEREAARLRLNRIAPITLLVFAAGFTIIAYDQVMSMEQTWFSNLFGAYFTWGGILSAVAAVALASCLHRKAPGFEGLIGKGQLHDIGKLLFAFCIFWFYLFWSQYLVIWYGNLPEETIFFYDRLGPQFMIDKGFSEAAFASTWASWDFQWSRLSEGYGWVSMTVWACIWIIPFWVLLGQKPKQTPWILGPVACVVLFGFWVERNLLVWPSVVKGEMTSFIGPIQLGIAAGFIGSYLLVFLIYTRLFPSIAVKRQ